MSPSTARSYRCRGHISSRSSIFPNPVELSLEMVDLRLESFGLALAIQRHVDEFERIVND
jgi:hypothetical protein